MLLPYLQVLNNTFMLILQWENWALEKIQFILGKKKFISGVTRILT